MDNALHPLAPHYLPGFITAPGETDVLLTVTILLLIGAVLMVGNLYLKLHSLPERMAHRANRVQFQVVAVLGLLALFTHQHIFWIAGLLLAMIRIPDFSTPLNRIADSLENQSGIEREDPSALSVPVPQRATPDVPQRTEVDARVTEAR